MASFFSFLKQKKLPSYDTIAEILRGPFTKQSALLYACLGAGVVLVYTLIISINDKFLVTVPAPGGNVTEGIIGSPRFLNPLTAQTDTDISITKLIYAGLTKTEADGEVAIELAESYSISPNGKDYTFMLRDDLEFSDGEKLTSADVAFTLSKLQDEVINPGSSAYWQNVSIEIPDNRTVIMHLPAEDKGFLARATFGVIPKHVWEGVPSEVWLEKSETMIPIGAGAFSITDIRKDRGTTKEIALERNRKYALGKPYLNTMHIISYPNQNSLRDALASGAVDMSLALDADTVTNDPLPNRIDKSRVPTPEVVALYRNTTESTLDDAALVTVLNRFIDKGAIIATVEHGYGTLVESPQESESSLDSTLATLQSMGFTYKDGVLTKNNTPVGFSIAVSNDAHNLATARMLASQLGSLGMIVEVKAFDQGTFQDDIKLSQYNVVLASTREETIMNSYRKVFTLYIKTLPYAVNQSVHNVIPPELENPMLRYSNSKDWYTKTDRIWKWITKIDTK